MTMHHAIIGAGPAATNAVEMIRRFETEPSQITMICDEPAHARMVLPYWLAGSIARDRALTGDEAYFERLGVDARIGVRVDQLFAHEHELVLSDGTSVRFDQLLIATGSCPVTPPLAGVELPGVQPMWSLPDVESACDFTAGMSSPHVVLMGAGFVGLIVLAAMAKRGWQLTVVERESRVLPQMLDTGAARIVQDWLRAQGVTIHTGLTVAAIRDGGGHKTVHLSDGATLDADLAILATGVRPNLELIQGTEIAVESGILVNDRMATSVPGIYAAGDVAQGPVLHSRLTAVHAIQPTAVDHGRVAGANMAGADVQYPGSLLMNILDVCGLHCASFGACDEAGADSSIVTNPDRSLYRKLLWNDDRLTGAIFVGQASDVGMLTDLGMVKGMVQAQLPMGIWKKFLQENPFDVRRPFIALGVADLLAKTRLLGQPTCPRGFAAGGVESDLKPNANHAMLMRARQSTHPF